VFLPKPDRAGARPAPTAFLALGHHLLGVGAVAGLDIGVGAGLDIGVVAGLDIGVGAGVAADSAPRGEGEATGEL
jgi:hypothetical protein